MADTDEEGVKDPLADVKRKLSSFFLAAGEQLKPHFPHLGIEMMQVGMDASPQEQLAKALKRGMSAGISVGVALVTIGLLFGSAMIAYLGVGMIPVFFFAAFLTVAKTPAIKVKKKVRELEKDLPYALKSVLLEVQSGVPLFNAMVTVTEGYGAASEEFQKIIAEINSGEEEAVALENAVLRNPSRQFRRVLWQLSNALRSGSDIGETLHSIVRGIMDEQMREIEQYGRELNPYTLMYMLASIIIPSLGVTFLMIISIFAGSGINQGVFYAILIFLVIFQFFFINFIRSKRPQVKQ